MHTEHTPQCSRMFTALLTGLVVLGFSDILRAEQRRHTTPGNYTDTHRHRPGHTETTPSTNSTWRPYSNPQALVTTGMSKGEVLLKAGKPDLEDLESHGTDGHLSLLVWTYVQTGHNASVTTLTFQGNKLIRINTKLRP